MGKSGKIVENSLNETKVGCYEVNIYFKFYGLSELNMSYNGFGLTSFSIRIY